MRRSLSGEGLRESAPFPFGSSVSPPSVRPPVRACVRACRGAAAAAVLFAPSFVAPLIFRSVGKVPWRCRDPRPLRLRAPTSSAWVASISTSRAPVDNVSSTQRNVRRVAVCRSQRAARQRQ